MKVIGTIPAYSIDVRFCKNMIQCYDLLSKKILASKPYNNEIIAVQKEAGQKFLILDEKNEIVSEISISIKLISKESELITKGGYVLDLHMLSQSHGYYFGYYELGEFKLTKDIDLIKIQSFPLQNCTTGRVTESKKVYICCRENYEYFLVKLNWKSGKKPKKLWKKVIPSAVMVMEIIDDIIFLGLKDGSIQLWDIQKDECIKNIRLFSSPISVLTTKGENLTLASKAGDIVRMSKKGIIQWKTNLSQEEIVGIYEDIDYILVINTIGEQFHIDLKSGKPLKHRFSNLNLRRNAGLSSNIIKYRDRFVITGYGGIWTFRWNNSHNSSHQYMNDPLMRVIHQHPFGFYSGDDDGRVCFWSLGEIDIKVVDFSAPLKNYEEYRTLKSETLSSLKKIKEQNDSYSKIDFKSKSNISSPKTPSKSQLHPPPPKPPGAPTIPPLGRKSYPYPIISSPFPNWSRGVQWIYCQKCGRKIPKGKYFTHTCKIKPSSPRVQRPSSPVSLRGVKMGGLRYLFLRRAKSEKKSRSESGSQLVSTNIPASPAGDKIAPKLKGEVQSFLEWIKDSEGLSGYINYYLQQNNTSIISELSKIYAELRQILFESTQTKGEDRNKILSNLSIPSRSEILHEISQNIFEQNRIITEHGVPEEIVSDLKSKKKEISREELLIDNLISNIQKNPSKKVIYLRLFLDRFRDLSDQDKNVIIKSIEDEADDNNDDDYYIPYPYIFTHPQPPDDFEPAPQSQIRTPSKEKDCEDEYYCQYCGRKLTKEEQFTHSCNRFYLG